MGLLLPHKRTLRVWKDMFSVSPDGGGGSGGGGKRNEVKVFSADSRYRLFRMLHTLEFKTVTFVTLTYPAEFPVDSRIYKAHLKEYRRRFERKFSPLRAVWRLEFQARGAPHYHLMYLDAPFIPVSDWCLLWSDVIHTDDENHRKIGVDVKLVTDAKEGRLIASYLAKYVGKVDERTAAEDDRKPGRYWGKWNIEEEIPVEYEVSSRTAELIVSYALAARGGGSSWEPTDKSICTIFGDNLGSDRFGSDIIRLVDKERSATRR